MKPKLWAVFDKDGNEPVRDWKGPGRAFVAKWAAWHSAGFRDDAAIKRAKRQGYTCEEVEIVRVQK